MDPGMRHDVWSPQERSILPQRGRGAEEVEIEVGGRALGRRHAKEDCCAYSILNYIIAGWASVVDADLMAAAERRTGDCADHFAGALEIALDFFNPVKVTFLFKML